MSLKYDPSAPQWARDLALTCAHEYAHAAVARALGVLGWVTIEPASPEDCASQHYRGRFTAATPIKRLRHRRVIGLAGVVAEDVLRGDLDVEHPDAAEMWLDSWDLIRREDLSASDAALIGTLRLPAVRACVSALRLLWPSVLREGGLHYQVEARQR